MRETTDIPTGPGDGPLGDGMTLEEAAALAHPSRRAVVRALGADPDGLTVAQISARVGLHHNAVRQHLEGLQRAGVVVAAPSAPTGRRGRPSSRYALAAAHPVAANGRRELVRLLVGLVRDAGADADRAEDFGRRNADVILGGGDGPEAVAAGLAALGFAPEEVTVEARRRGGQMELRLRSCPFRDAVLADGGEVVCALHRGLLRGAFARFGGDAALDPADPIAGGCRVLATGLGDRTAA